MKTKLTATKSGKKAVHSIYGEDSFECTLRATSYILKKAKDSILWKKGKIVMRNEDGHIIHTMDEKR